MSDLPVYEIAFTAEFDWSGDEVSVLLIPVDDLERMGRGDILERVRAGEFAEVCVPHHTPSMAIGYTFYVLNLPNYFPAFREVQVLKAVTPELHQAYGHLAQPMSML